MKVPMRAAAMPAQRSPAVRPVSRIVEMAVRKSGPGPGMGDPARVGRHAQPHLRLRRAGRRSGRRQRDERRPGTLEEIACLVSAGRMRVPVAAAVPVDRIRAAVELQAGRHVKGKLVIDL